MDTSITVEFTTEFGCEVRHTASIDPIYFLENDWTIISTAQVVTLGQSIRLELSGDYPIGEIVWFSQDTLSIARIAGQLNSSRCKINRY